MGGVAGEVTGPDGEAEEVSHDVGAEEEQEGGEELEFIAALGAAGAGRRVVGPTTPEEGAPVVAISDDLGRASTEDFIEAKGRQEGHGDGLVDVGSGVRGMNGGALTLVIVGIVGVRRFYVPVVVPVPKSMGLPEN